MALVENCGHKKPEMTVDLRKMKVGCDSSTIAKGVQGIWVDLRETGPVVICNCSNCIYYREGSTAKIDLSCEY